MEWYINIIIIITRKPALSLSYVFWLGHLPRSKIVSKSIFYTKSYIITILNFFWSVKSKKMALQEMVFPIYFKHVI